MEEAGTNTGLDAELIVRDEWVNDNIQFPNKSDAWLARFALSKEIDPVMVDAVYSLIKNPAFDPAECTLRSVAEVHAYAADYRRVENNRTARESSPMAIPTFVWEEVLSRIGDQWVAYAYRCCSGRDFHILGWSHVLFLFHGHHSLKDLRSASLVHRCWTRPAKRQIGRVLVLPNIYEATLSSAIRSGLYGACTEILALTDSQLGGWEYASPGSNGVNALISNLPYLKTFMTRFPRLSTLHFQSSSPNHPIALLKATPMKVSTSLSTLCIANTGDKLKPTINDVLECVQGWSALQRLYLAGFGVDVPTLTTQPLSSLGLPQLLSIFISGGDYQNIHRSALIHWILWTKPTLIGDSNRLVVSEVCFRRMPGMSVPFVDPEVNNMPENADVDFASLAQQPILSWLPSIQSVHLWDIRETEATQILNLATSVDVLSWSGMKTTETGSLSYTPPVSLPVNIRDLRLYVLATHDEVWHPLDRDLNKFLLQKRSPGLQQVTIGVSSLDTSNYEESEVDARYIYLPRSSYTCESLNISLTTLL